MVSLRFLATATLPFLCAAQTPAEVYDASYGNGSSILLSIGNGGAGQSGLIKALADAFIEDKVSNGSDPFRVAWYQSDTTYSINYLKDGLIDIGITYSTAAERIAIEQGIALAPDYYAWRDHFLIVGPPSNPANISGDSDIYTIFSDLHEAAEAANTTPSVRFLSRYDKSATNIKESDLWISIGQVPWSTAYSTWYHQFITFPIQALTAAILLDEYTLTDRGTFLSLPANLTSETTIFKAATDDAEDPLLNPAHLLVGARAPNPEMAKDFAGWLVGSEGQGVVRGFEKNGEQLYSPAP
ncbi:uncharacterized protein B0H64DRAFT_431914 [Chaetomium fimeti]|uniref:PBP domain-containing protein n=1 Tax=Chaetomium fimeti TaxID=1854472 RepID=A0AAE0LRY7_9PEZI|nr:hypothetical protein B0H64DRAFT_436212 [Chaetomium fimeti]KAK3295100.1 hypothetical protein B0H64DRAFT_431914 [Chaetomium fimeti]